MVDRFTSRLVVDVFDEDAPWLVPPPDRGPAVKGVSTWRGPGDASLASLLPRPVGAVFPPPTALVSMSQAQQTLKKDRGHPRCKLLDGSLRRDAAVAAMTPPGELERVKQVQHYLWLLDRGRYLAERLRYEEFWLRCVNAKSRDDLERLGKSYRRASDEALHNYQLYSAVPAKWLQYIEEELDNMGYTPHQLMMRTFQLDASATRPPPPPVALSLPVVVGLREVEAEAKELSITSRGRFGASEGPLLDINLSPDDQGAPPPKLADLVNQAKRAISILTDRLRGMLQRKEEYLQLVADAKEGRIIISKPYDYERGIAFAVNHRSRAAEALHPLINYKHQD